MNCQLKRTCCLDCIEKHNEHKYDLKTFKQITQWKKNTTQNYDIYQKKISQIVEIMVQAEKYLTSLGEDLEKPFEEIMNDELQKQVHNLFRIQHLQQPFNQLISNLETLMEPISQIFSIVEASSLEKSIKGQPILNDSNYKFQTIGSEQQIQEEKQLEFRQNEGKQKTKQLKTQIYLDLIEKTTRIRRDNDLDIHQYPKYYRSSFENLDDYKTIILIGTQNSQKQNLINLFVNYYYDVEFSDQYRFEIIDDIDITKMKQNDEYEQTKVYYITPLNGKSGLRIIYTPDYSDDLNYDDQNRFDRIYDIIFNSASLNQNILIGFVIPQQVQLGSFFMLESILSKFSNILIKNIVFLFPDCADDYPKQKQILQSQTETINGIFSPVFKMIPKMKHFWFLKFNTKVLYLENKTQENKCLWEMELFRKQIQLQQTIRDEEQVQ
ncbi:unnamed protein product (macronuclear) [Paramecium tetraurelia]|uniref:G domain-containing protein n=1 Tax=Paramecium tetraurelia TaxID=5888 RepID=A0D9N6_PARTE|nr:uncharacterized protein GSPATT00014684001 [Paramecium tetraurelia]CAK79753.1 unnamed protein product [Paramecium tetraurelia]|eukprot:XP_001447150.1 hypothetical protein (macronuclear) [Paramecium tetraurelia strain d4-2]